MGAEKAKKKVEDIVRVIEVGEIFEDAEVVNIQEYGAFVRLTPGQDGMLHISELDWARTPKVTDKVNLGDKVRVKVIKIERGKIDVSMKALKEKPEGYVEPERPPRRDYSSRSRNSRDRGGDRRDRGSRDSRGSRGRERTSRKRE